MPILLLSEELVSFYTDTFVFCSLFRYILDSRYCCTKSYLLTCEKAECRKSFQKNLLLIDLPILPDFSVPPLRLRTLLFDDF
jgi:hypothetical protein